MARVLLVEDDPANMRLLAAMLAPDGYELALATDGTAALAAIEARVPDLVLLDLIMPGGGGLAVLERLKTDRTTQLTPVVVVSGSAERAERIRAIELGADEFLSKPVDRVELRARVRALLRLKYHVDQLEYAEDVLITMARTVEARDPDLAGHCERMAERAMAIGEDLGLDAQDLRALHLGAPLHDLGQIGVPDAILLKAGPLTEAERGVIRTHPGVGEAILRPLASMAAVLPLVRHHHERLDGTGYPDGLGAEAIGLPVRILSVIDVYDALTTDRPYRTALPRAEALAVLRDEAARGWWDPAVIAGLSRSLERSA